VGSLLERTEYRIVKRQIEYGRQQDLPWGISESGFNARDLELTYQYSNFGVPGLGLKRVFGLDDAPGQTFPDVLGASRLQVGYAF